MATTTNRRAPCRPPLESFVRDYVEICGGVWDEIEPQVYDILLPTDAAVDTTNKIGRDLLRIVFDPEALPEHPGSQLVCYGTPLIERLLETAVSRGRFARAYVNGLSLAAQGFFRQLRRSLLIASGLNLTIHRVRPLSFPQAVFWFQVKFVSDQPEYQTLCVAIDLHYGRQVRHADKLLAPTRLSDEPAVLLPEASTMNLRAVYELARQRVVRSLTALAGARRRELDERTTRTATRMARYYADLRAELDAHRRLAESRGEDVARFVPRREAVAHEEGVRLAELRKRSELQIELQLNNLLLVHQPKLVAYGTLAGPESQIPLELVWDLLTNSLEAPPCPRCGKPTFRLSCGANLHPECPECPRIETSPTTCDAAE